MCHYCKNHNYIWGGSLVREEKLGEYEENAR